MLKLKFIVIVIAVILGGAVGCSQRDQNNLKYSKQVVNIEGCEYFYSDVRDGWLLSHKGNCRNSIHQCK